MKCFSDDIDPKKFSSYDEYLEALRAKEQFEEKVEAVDKLMKETKSEDEYIKGMEDLGFTYVDDEYCEQAWCSKNRKCLKVEIEIFQNEFNEMFFDDLLSEEDKIIMDELVEDWIKNGCGLPRSWHRGNSKEHNAILFLFMLGDVLFFGERNLLKQANIQNFARNCFLLVQSILHSRPLSREFIEKIKYSIENDKLFSEKDTKKINKLFEKIINFK